MKKKVAALIFVISFSICGCGIDSIFDSGAVEWAVAFLVAISCLLVLGGEA